MSEKSVKSIEIVYFPDAIPDTNDTSIVDYPEKNVIHTIKDNKLDTTTVTDDVWLFVLQNLGWVFN